MHLQFVTDYPDIGDGLLYIHYPSSSSDRRDVSIELYEVSSADADGLLYAHRVSNAGGDDSQEVITFRYRNENVHLYPPMDGVLLATVGKLTTAEKAGLPSSMFFMRAGVLHMRKLRWHMRMVLHLFGMVRIFSFPLMRGA